MLTIFPSLSVTNYTTSRISVQFLRKNGPKGSLYAFSFEMCGQAFEQERVCILKLGWVELRKYT